MKTGNLLSSAVQFVFSVLVMLLGIFFIGLQYASHLRFTIARFFSETAVSFSLIGFLILGCGLLLLVGFYTMNRGGYYCVKMGNRQMGVDPAIVREYVADYWKGVFPNQRLDVEIVVSKEQKFEMFVEFPASSFETQEIVLEKAEGDLAQILKKKIGYQKEFSVCVLVK
jgi:hypothetical protein